MALKRSLVRRGRERRGSERADARLSMRVEAGATAGAARIVTESQNISASGVYCHASHYLAPLSKVQLTIILPRVPGGPANVQELLKCDGIVVRSEQRPTDRTGTPYELACMFTALEPGSRRRLEEFVTWRNLQALRAALAPDAASRRRATIAADRDAEKPALKPSTNGARKPAARKGVRAAVRNGARSGAGRARG